MCLLQLEVSRDSLAHFLPLFGDDADMIANLHAIITMLEQEQEKWNTSHIKNRTWQEISRYTSVLYLLIEYIEEKDVGAFVYAFQQHSISIKGIRACFRIRPGVKDDSYTRRITVNQMFGGVCDKIVAFLSKPVAKEMAAKHNFSPEEARAFFTQESKEASQDPVLISC